MLLTYPGIKNCWVAKDDLEFPILLLQPRFNQAYTFLAIDILTEPGQE